MEVMGDCPNFDTYADGKEFCHDHTNTVHWWKIDGGKLRCDGNLHKCKSEKYRWMAGLTEKEKERYVRLNVIQVSE